MKMAGSSILVNGQIQVWLVLKMVAELDGILDQRRPFGYQPSHSQSKIAALTPSDETLTTAIATRPAGIIIDRAAGKHNAAAKPEERQLLDSFNRV